LRRRFGVGSNGLINAHSSSSTIGAPILGSSDSEHEGLSLNSQGLPCRRSYPDALSG
jgi:hypothetical protein